MSTTFEKYLLLKNSHKKAATVSKPVPFLVLHEIFDRVLEDLGKREDEGLLCFGPKDPTLLAEERKALAHVDSVWEACLDGKTTQEAFKAAVNAWHGVIIKLYTLQDQNV